MKSLTNRRKFLALLSSMVAWLVSSAWVQIDFFNDVRHEVAVGVQNARNQYYPTPVPDGFYTGDAEPLKSIGLLRDYCAWTWDNALFVICDCEALRKYPTAGR